jgi:hypothetical protein
LRGFFIYALKPRADNHCAPLSAKLFLEPYDQAAAGDRAFGFCQF